MKKRFFSTPAGFVVNALISLVIAAGCTALIIMEAKTKTFYNNALPSMAIIIVLFFVAAGGFVSTVSYLLRANKMAHDNKLDAAMARHREENQK